MEFANQQTTLQPKPLTATVEVSSLIDQCVKALADVGVSKERTDIMLADNMVAWAKASGLEDQRFALNLFWQTQLGPFGDSAFRARGSLLANGQEGDWITYFKSKVVPFIVDNNLPFPWQPETQAVDE